MSRFNTPAHKAKPPVTTATSPLGTTSTRTKTFEGGMAWEKTPQTDLFMRATASFADGSASFYESGNTRDDKLRDLARHTAVEDFIWFAQFVKWLRRTANIRTAAIMIACDGVKARLDAGLVAVGEISNRSVIDSVLYRADEPGEMLAYWMSAYGRRVPKPVKRGIADAVRRLYTSKSLLKYDTGSHAFRFADVLNICHASPQEARSLVIPPEESLEDALDRDVARNGWQGELFRYALDRRHHPETAEIPPSLTVIARNKALRESNDTAQWLNADVLRSAGMTWEDTLSAVGSKTDKAKLWEAMIPSMGYMALLRNLRNFDEAGVSNQVANQVIVKLVREDEVAKSRQLPFRFYTAYKNAPSLRWAHALETALDLCLPNIPVFTGRTLVLIDSSGSMQSMMSGKSTLSCVTAAALFGSAVALRNAGNVDLYHFATYHAPINVPRGGSVLKLVQHIESRVGEVGYGTEIGRSIQGTYAQHDRVLVFTDGQTFGGYLGDIAASVPADIPVYAFNLRGYTGSPMPTGQKSRFELGGLTDQTFKLIPLLETGKNGVWPWELTAA